MSGAQALHAALALARTPQLAGAMRAQPLPPGVLLLLRIVAEEEGALAEAALVAGRPHREITEAATLFIQKVMLHATASADRVLGVAPGADRAEARTHMRLLMLWLHPDKSNADWRAAFAGRVLASWRAFSTGAPGPEPSGAFPVSRPRTPSRGSRTGSRPRRGLRLPWVAVPIEQTRRPWKLRAGILLAIILLIGFALMPDSAPSRLIASWMEDATPSETAPTNGAKSFGTLPNPLVVPAASRGAETEPQP